MGDASVWAIEGALNPTVLRLHVRRALTERTIVTCPPEPAPPPLDGLLDIDAIRSIDLHRYRVRLNLRPGGGRGDASRRAGELLGASWGASVSLPPDPLPRAFAHGYDGSRRVAESLEMAEAAGVPALAAALRVAGVVEAIAAPGLILVRIGRLFSWDEVEPDVEAALAQ